jgi:uncharacterized membrane protein YtjA (UPF0391 family)
LLLDDYPTDGAAVAPQLKRSIKPWEYENMLRWALLFLIIALVAGALGLFRASFIASEIAWILFVVFLLLFVVSLVFGRRGPPV